MLNADIWPARGKLAVFTLVAAVTLSTGAASSARQSAGPLQIIASAQTPAESPIEPAAILAAARLLYVHSRTVLVKSEVIASELRKRAELQAGGLLITTDPNAADLTMEVRRSNLTTEYPYVVIDMKTRVVVASGKVNSIFGTAAAKIAKGFAKQVARARTSSAAKPKQ